MTHVTNTLKRFHSRVPSVPNRGRPLPNNFVFWKRWRTFGGLCVYVVQRTHAHHLAQSRSPKIIVCGFHWGKGLKTMESSFGGKPWGSSTAWRAHPWPISGSLPIQNLWDLLSQCVWGEGGTWPSWMSGKFHTREPWLEPKKWAGWCRVEGTISIDSIRVVGAEVKRKSQKYKWLMLIYGLSQK